MNLFANEIKRSQRVGALAAGYGDVPDYLTELKNNISDVREIASLCCSLTVKNKTIAETAIKTEATTNGISIVQNLAALPASSIRM